uniref:Endonuclease/exonuclease/phosphatase domain-containing protein n=1 Tax=Chenopodium quinoa TaxID=63459 RepID=A0A803N0N3_CHEQI
MQVSGKKSSIAALAQRMALLTGEGTDTINHADIPYCSIHSNDVATVQCIECVNYGLPVEHSYHCSKKCFLDAWKNHYLRHRNANVSNSCNKKDSKARGTLNRCNFWPPGDMVSWFDEKIEVVVPTGRMWVNKVGPSNALIPSADGVGFSFKLQSASPHHLRAAVCAEETFVKDPTIQRLNLPLRSLIWLPDSLNTEKRDLTEKVSKVGNFTVLTYNILSHVCVNMDKYFYCPEWALTWEYRRKNLLHELIQYDADILCLQEVQSDHFENFFKPELEKVGYSVAYKKKTGTGLYTCTLGSGYTFDGCATFYRNDIFMEAKSYQLEFSQSALSLIDKLELGLRKDALKRLIKDNVALIVILEVVGNFAKSAASSSRLCAASTKSAASSSRLCVVNTHIFADVNFADVKLLQVSDLINAIELSQKTIDPRMPLFICGDMNSIPGSDPYILLTKHEVNVACAQALDQLCIFQHLKLQHSMKLASTYVSAFSKYLNDTKGRRMKMKHSETGEPFFTNLSRAFTCLSPFCGTTLDYIFYTADSLEIEGLLEPPDFESVGRSLPSPLWSSDHVALMGSFRITRPFLG